MTPTDELRALLDERGVEWTNPNSCLRDEMTSWVANGFDYDAFEVPDGTLLLTAAHQDDLTPEQAIAATCEPWNTSSDHAVQAANERGAGLVPETKYIMALDEAREASRDAEIWRYVASVYKSKCRSLKETNADLRRIIGDMKAATVGAGTCHVKAVNKLGDSFGFSLSCGHSMVNPFDDRPDYCPWCGRRVIEEEAE